jgi:hypothetical protein
VRHPVCDVKKNEEEKVQGKGHDHREAPMLHGDHAKIVDD